MRQKRPVLDIPMTVIEVLLDIMALIAVIYILLFLKTNYQLLPTEIPTHFDGSGSPDGWGNKNSLLYLTGMMLLFFGGLKILERFPHYYNYLQPITEENAAYQYLNGRKMIAFLKTEMVMIFAYMIWGTIAVSTSQMAGLGFWFMPVFLGLIALTTIYYLIRMMKKPNHQIP